MTWTFHAKHPSAKRITDKCKSASALWTASRVLADVHWVWDEEKRCYKTHRWTHDAHYKDVREWPAHNALSSLLRAIREDDRLSGDPTFRWIGLRIAVEYVESMIDGRRV